jgi:ABC-type multidrug transport system fused ATPase/permease subunit
MNRKPSLPPCGTLAPPTLEGHIELRGVKFAYPARPRHIVLNGLSFEVNPGAFGCARGRAELPRGWCEYCCPREGPPHALTPAPR